MVAKNLILSDINPVKSSDTCGEVLTLMSIYHVKHLPVLDGRLLQGIVSEEDLYQLDEEALVADNYIKTGGVSEHDHLFEVMSEMSKRALTLLPVTNSEQEYLGCVTQESVLNYFSNSFSFTDVGSILVLEVAKSNYSLVEISSIVEQENAVILGTFLSSVEGSNQLQVTLKINKTTIDHIIASFERHDYTIVGSFYEDDYYDNLKDRYDALMSYLSI